jgi:2-polyprenyl-3-methyl-5-hydroxy-6-metoxy-1,4-benzoquinol methylase
MFGLGERNLTAELMDDPDLDVRSHQKALRGLGRINAVTRPHRLLVKKILKLGSALKRPISVLDLACGSGDLLCAIGIAASRMNVPVHLTGRDITSVAIEFAEKRAIACGQEVSLQVADVFDASDRTTYDVACCSLFLHHLTNEKALQLLRLMKQLANHMVLISDLRRTLTGYLYATVGTRLLTTSRIVHIDGVKSVRAAFSISEVQAMVNSAEMFGAEIVNFWPQRFLLTWTKESPADE